MSEKWPAEELPPPWPGAPPDPAIEEYHAEPVYWRKRAEALPTDRANLVTARCLAQWATRFRGTALEGSEEPAMYHQGSLPESPDEREAVVAGLFAWAEALARDPSRPRGVTTLDLTLFRGDDLPLILENQLPVCIFLRPREFELLQQCWEQHGLPRDLGYIRSATRSAIEVSTFLDAGPVLRRTYYSPLEWAGREQLAIDPIVLPSEEERRQAFYDACVTFQTAVLLRIQQLTEPGKRPDQVLLDELDFLLGHVALARFRTGGLPNDRVHRYKERLAQRHFKGAPEQHSQNP